MFHTHEVNSFTQVTAPANTKKTTDCYAFVTFLPRTSILVGAILES